MGICFSCFNARDDGEDAEHDHSFGNCDCPECFRRDRLAIQLQYGLGSVTTCGLQLARHSLSSPVSDMPTDALSTHSNSQLAEPNTEGKVENAGGTPTGTKHSQEKPEQCLSVREVEGEIPNQFNPSDDEDECPICFEGYSYENPMIWLQCSHEFHLGCIYEWMERSVNCPICQQEMLFRVLFN